MDAGSTGVARDLVAVDARSADLAADWRNLISHKNYAGYGRTAPLASPG